jgi:hypothetical protein
LHEFQFRKNSTVNLLTQELLKTTVMFIFILIFILALPFSLLGQQVPSEMNRKILFSIGKDEKPVFNESSILLSPIGSSVTVITSDEENRVYVYENGEKRGPFKDIAGTGMKKAEDNPEEYDPIFRRESDPDYQKYIEYSNDGQAILKFGGKSFGPFQFILEFYSTNDKTAFSAIVMKEGKPEIIGSAGNTYELDGQPGYNYISPTGKRMMVTAIKENNDTNEVIIKNLAKANTQEPNKPGKEAEAKQKKRIPEAFIYFQDGKKYGPYDPKKITGYNPAFIKTGGDNWLLTMDSKLYINGKVTRDLTNERISPANIWLTEDGKRYVIIVYNRIEFSDGSVYKDPLKIRIMTDNKKITIWWLSFENGKDIVLSYKCI